MADYEIIGKEEKTTLSAELRMDGKELLFLMNGVVVLWFSIDGRVGRKRVSIDNQDKLSGMKLDSEGKIQLRKGL